ncbi:MAG: hypothetical protein AMS27_05010 [Bacteroides sp. SM23_62_1]|nr:MAG: hypothetical protein AMS27_05010 [Bacteroides sp. SM23_62_1]
MAGRLTTSQSNHYQENVEPGLSAGTFISPSVVQLSDSSRDIHFAVGRCRYCFQPGQNKEALPIIKTGGNKM